MDPTESELGQSGAGPTPVALPTQELGAVRAIPLDGSAWHDACALQVDKGKGKKGSIRAQYESPRLCPAGPLVLITEVDAWGTDFQAVAGTQGLVTDKHWDCTSTANGDSRGQQRR
jgi:hypothetical protein